MRVVMSQSGSFDKTLRFLKNAENFNPTPIMRSTGSKIVSSLRASTPRRTGGTAGGWNYTVTRNSSGATMYVYNNSHPETSANVALLLDHGHGTRTGGYVPGRHYIKPASSGLLSIGSEALLKAVSR